jgi:hypothetical protein
MEPRSQGIGGGGGGEKKRIFGWTLVVEFLQWRLIGKEHDLWEEDHDFVEERIVEKI